MAEPTNHPTDLLQDAIDGRLDASQRTSLEAHVATCERCRAELTALRWTKAQLRAAADSAPVSDELAGQLQRALDDEDRRHSEIAARPQAPSAFRRPIYWLGAAAVLIAAVWMAGRLERSSAPEQAAADFRAFTSGAAPLSVRTSDPPTLEAHFQGANLAFAARVFDFGMMDYALTGGGVHRFQGRPSAVFVYRSGEGRSVVCQMYEGEASDLPAPLERRRENDIDFLVYRQDDLTVVFWQEGGVLCVLVADGDPESAFRLAVAKAVRV